ncbi:hypothetical protein BK004_04540 [bacterium CG10_46_32]|nr:MAG: hypothetical protein BK004_04540 [bacterium CG10_46_32]PIR55710.1 MAG: hypothetical protein COU73_04580 [Parcubacteria group bacterium CG10_big_fil_rev_8_21_14_0_10_46_32]
MSKILIIKVGSTSLVFPQGTLRRKMFKYIVAQIVKARARGYQVVVITSGATLAGLRKAPGLASIQDEVLRKRIAASVGQPIVVRAWIEAFAQCGIIAGQVLRTHADFGRGAAAIASVEFLRRYMECGCVPIINEDDTRSAEEMKAYINEKGDNDQLAFRVARALKAERAILLTDVDGLCRIDDSGKCISEPVQIVRRVNSAIRNMVRDQPDGRPTGMRSKVNVANKLQRAGITANIANAAKWVIIPILEGKCVGTTFPAH